MRDIRPLRMASVTRSTTSRPSPMTSSTSSPIPTPPWRGPSRHTMEYGLSVGRKAPEDCFTIPREKAALGRRNIFSNMNRISRMNPVRKKYKVVNVGIFSKTESSYVSGATSGDFQHTGSTKSSRDDYHNGYGLSQKFMQIPSLMESGRTGGEVLGGRQSWRESGDLHLTATFSRPDRPTILIIIISIRR